jgi:hypothetical protein
MTIQVLATGGDVVRECGSVEEAKRVASAYASERKCRTEVYDTSRSDAYRVVAEYDETGEFWRIARGCNPSTKLRTAEGIYADGLVDLCERETGLAFRMVRVVGVNA